MNSCPIARSAGALRRPLRTRTLSHCRARQDGELDGADEVLDGVPGRRVRPLGAGEPRLREEEAEEMRIAAVWAYLRFADSKD